MGWATFWAIFVGRWAIFLPKHLITQIHSNSFDSASKKNVSGFLLK
jgi:hypothetical protein